MSVVGIFEKNEFVQNRRLQFLTGVLHVPRSFASRLGNCRRHSLRGTESMKDNTYFVVVVKGKPFRFPGHGVRLYDRKQTAEGVAKVLNANDINATVQRVSLKS